MAEYVRLCFVYLYGYLPLNNAKSPTRKIGPRWTFYSTSLCNFFMTGLISSQSPHILEEKSNWK